MPSTSALTVGVAKDDTEARSPFHRQREVALGLFGALLLMLVLTVVFAAVATVPTVSTVPAVVLAGPGPVRLLVLLPARVEGRKLLGEPATVTVTGIDPAAIALVIEAGTGSGPPAPTVELARRAGLSADVAAQLARAAPGTREPGLVVVPDSADTAPGNVGTATLATGRRSLAAVLRRGLTDQ